MVFFVLTVYVQKVYGTRYGIKSLVSQTGNESLVKRKQVDAVKEGVSIDREIKKDTL